MRKMSRHAVRAGLVALAVLASACDAPEQRIGGAADGGGTGPGESTAPERYFEAAPPDPPVAGDDRSQVAEVIRDVQESLAAGQAIAVCGELTSAARRAVERSSDRAHDTCEAVVGDAVSRWHAHGHQPVLSEIVSVRIEGNRAVAMVRDSEKPPYPVLVVWRDVGHWQLSALNLENRSGLQPVKR